MGKNKKRFLIALCALVFCVINIFLMAAVLISRPAIQKKVLSKISEKLGYKIQIQDIKISLSHGLGISINNAVFESRNGFLIISCPSIFVSYKIPALLKGNLIPESAILEGVDVIFDRNKLSLKKGSKPLRYKKIFLIAASLSSLSIKDGNVHIKGLRPSMNKVCLELKRKSPNKIHLSFKSEFLLEEHKFPFYSQGVVYMTEKGSIEADLNVETSHFPLTYIHKKNLISFINGFAAAQMKLAISSTGRIKASGKASLKNPHFLLQDKDKQKKEYKFGLLNIELNSDYLSKIVRIHNLKLMGTDLELDVDSKIDFNHTPPYILLNVNSEFMSIEAFKKIFPACLLPDWLENRLFPIIKKGKVKKVRFSISGTTDQITHIDNPKNKNVLYGSLVMDGLLLWPKGARYSLKKIKGEVLLKNGDFFIRNIKADFASSHIKDASITIKDVYQDTRRYLVHTNGSFRLEDLIAQAHMEFTPKIVLRILKNIKKISGLMDANVKCEYKGSWNMPVFNNSSARLINCHIVYKDLPLPVYIKNGRFWIDSQGNYNFNGNGMLGKSNMYASAVSDPLLKQVKLSISGNTYISEILRPYVKDKIVIDGPIKLTIHANKRENTWRANGNLHFAQKSSLQIPPLLIRPTNSDITFSMIYSPKKLHLKRVLFRSKNCSFLASGSYNRAYKVLGLRFRTDELCLKHLRIRYRDEYEGSKGKITARLNINVPFNNPLDTLVYGPLEIKGLTIRKKGNSLIYKGNMKIQFSGKKVSIASWDMNWEKFPLHLKGYVKGWEHIKGKLSINIDRMDLAKLRTEIGTKQGGNSNVLKNSELDLSLLISEGKCKKIIFKPISAQIRIRKGDIYIPNLTASLAPGTIKIKGHMINSKKPDICFDSHIQLSKMPLQDIFSSIGIKKYLDGKMDMKSHLYVKANRVGQIPSHLNGQVAISVADGKIYKAQPVLKILDFFSLSKIWKFDPDSLFKEGVPFDVIKIKADIKDGIISSDKMFIKSTALNAAAKGYLDLNRKRIDLGVGIQPLNTVDSIIGKLPIVGYIVAGKDKKITLYYFKVKGPLNDVKITQQPFKNLVGGTLGIFKRILLTPSRIFEDMGG